MSNTDLYIIIGGTIAAIILTYLKEKHNLINSENPINKPSQSHGSKHRQRKTAEKSRKPKDSPK